MKKIKFILVSCVDKFKFIREDYDRPAHWEYVGDLVFSCTLWILMVTSTIWLVISFLVDQYILESHSTWFQRSGSILVAISVSILANERLAWEHRVMYQQFFDKMNVGIPYSDFDPRSEKFCRWSRFFVVLANGFLLIGTLIWGYGDLLVN